MNSPRRLDDWLDHISRQHPRAIDMGLTRVGDVWRRMALSVTCPMFTVGGTNGKGSTCAMLEKILAVAGYRVGCYTSPHLLRFNERIRIVGRQVDDAVIAHAFATVEAARGDTALTYFEFATLAAIKCFVDARCEVLVLEVGLGGRLDAVNLFDADAAIVVSVDLDHTEYLGPDRESIGWEKAHIYRARRPAFYGDRDPPSRLLEHAHAIGADLRLAGRDYRWVVSDQQWRFEGRETNYSALPLPALRGPCQVANAAGVLAMLETQRERLPVSAQEIKRGLLEVELAGRLQVLPGRPSIVLDVAHNAQAAAVLADALGTMGFYERTLAVFSILKDKAIEDVVANMRRRVDAWYVAPVESDRATSIETLALAIGRAAPGAPVTRFSSVSAALAGARAGAGPNDRILVFGSFYTVAEALRALGRG